MPQSGFDPHQPITVANAWPYFLSFAGIVFVAIRKMILRLVQLEFKTPLSEIKSELKILSSKVEESHNSSIDIQIIVARLDERIESIQKKRN